MAKMDRLIGTLVAEGISLAHLHPDSEILVEVDGESKPLGTRVMTSEQIEVVLYEVLHDEQRSILSDRGHLDFEYSCDEGSVNIRAFREGDALKMQMRVLRTGAPADSSGTRRPSSSSSESRSPRSNGISAFADPNKPLRMGDSSRRSYPHVRAGEKADIDRYLSVMLRSGCSDLHLTSNNPPMYRKDGDIIRMRDNTPLSPTDNEALIVPIMPDRNYAEFLACRDTDFAYEVPGMGRFRVNVFMDRLGPGAVLRLIPEDILTVEQLDLPQSVIDLCYLTKGLVLVTGPTGSGKSTTLAALIDFINRNRAAHIITIEDPIEFVHPNKKCLINQREVGVHTEGFKRALRAALREDPDIVLVGEMRDLETIAIAMETAETGHLVFGTLHTNTAPSTVDRIIDQFPPDRQSQVRTMLSESLRAVITQTLCKKRGGGRQAALEILMIDHAMSNLIREGKTFQIPSMMSTKRGAGNLTLNESLGQLVKKGVVDPSEAYLKAADKGGMAKVLEQMGIKVQM